MNIRSNKTFSCFNFLNLITKSKELLFLYLLSSQPVLANQATSTNYTPLPPGSLTHCAEDKMHCIAAVNYIDYGNRCEEMRGYFSNDGGANWTQGTSHYDNIDCYHNWVNDFQCGEQDNFNYCVAAGAYLTSRQGCRQSMVFYTDDAGVNWYKQLAPICASVFAWYDGEFNNVAVEGANWTATGTCTSSEYIRYKQTGVTHDGGKNIGWGQEPIPSEKSSESIENKTENTTQAEPLANKTSLSKVSGRLFRRRHTNPSSQPVGVNETAQHSLRP